MRFLTVTALAALTACTPGTSGNTSTGGGGPVADPPRTVAPAAGESRFKSITQITFGGENAEAYFSPDGQWITLQSTRDGRACDQQYVMRADGTGLRRISDGRGKTTCGWFFPGSERVFYASTTAPINRDWRPDP